MGCFSSKKKGLSEVNLMRYNLKTKLGVEEMMKSKNFKKISKETNVKNLKLYVCIYDFVPMNDEELALDEYSHVLVSESEMGTILEYVKAYKAENPEISGFVPRSFLVPWDSLEANEGYSTLHRTEAEAQLQPMQYLFRSKQAQGVAMVLSIKNENNMVYHILVKISINGEYVINENVFKSVPEIVEYLRNQSYTPFKRVPPTINARVEITTIDKDLIKVKERLGNGEFGEVQLCELKMAKTTRLVALKTFFNKNNASATSPEYQKKLKSFMNEIYVMKYLMVPSKNETMSPSAANVANIVALIGAQIDGTSGEIGMILEYCEGNSVLVHVAKMQLWDIILMTIALVAGCDYMASKKIIHFDIAARNVLRHITSGGNVVYKIADFGLSRYWVAPDETPELAEKSLVPILTLENLVSTPMPIRWTAPEIFAVFNANAAQKQREMKHVTPKCNLWQTCMTVLEVCNEGQPPFSKVYKQKAQVKTYLTQFISEYNTNPMTYPRPENMDQSLYEILMESMYKPPYLRYEPSSILQQLKNFRKHGEKIIYTNINDNALFSSQKK